MKMPKFTAFVVMAMAVLAIPTVQAQVIFANGTTNVVDTTINDYIEVEDSFGGDPTTVTFNTGADVTGDTSDRTVSVFNTSIIVINDGTFAQDIASFDSSTVSIFGGNLNDDLVSLNDSVVNFSGGTLADDLIARNDSIINVSGGTLSDDVEAFNSSTINLLGGSYGQDIESIGGTIDISGGVIAANDPAGAIRTDEDGTILLQGLSLVINGTPFDTTGDVTDVDGSLSGTLPDVSAFSKVPCDRDPSAHGFDSGQLTLLIIPQPTSLVLPVQ